jgi:hypothetical protein
MRREFLRHEQVQFGILKMLTQSAQSGRHQHGIAEILELQGEDFRRVHDENWSS